MIQSHSIKSGVLQQWKAKVIQLTHGRNTTQKSSVGKNPKEKQIAKLEKNSFLLKQIQN